MPSYYAQLYALWGSFSIASRSKEAAHKRLRHMPKDVAGDEVSEFRDTWYRCYSTRFRRLPPRGSEAVGSVARASVPGWK